MKNIIFIFAVLFLFQGNLFAKERIAQKSLAGLTTKTSLVVVRNPNSKAAYVSSIIVTSSAAGTISLVDRPALALTGSSTLNSFSPDLRSTTTTNLEFSTTTAGNSTTGTTIFSYEVPANTQVTLPLPALRLASAGLAIEWTSGGAATVNVIAKTQE